jgi:hypothetical protein
MSPMMISSLPSSDDRERDGKATQCYTKGNLTSDTMIAMILKVPISIDEIFVFICWCFFDFLPQSTDHRITFFSPQQKYFIVIDQHGGNILGIYLFDL